MKATQVLMLMIAALLGGCMFVGCAAYNGYNRAISLDEGVKGAWAQVENQLQRRFDLVPNLVETVKGVAGHEKDVFLGIAKARESYFQAKGPAAKAKAAGGFESALSRLLVLRETYPELKANQSFLKLQDTLEGTENRLSVERKRYNETVKAVNIFIRSFTGRLYASMAGVEKAEYFEITEQAKQTPKVDFGGGGGAPDKPGQD